MVTLKRKFTWNDPRDLLSMDKERVCRLVKSLHGLKQTLKQWHEKFNKVMLFNEFKINELNKCVYIKNTYTDYVIVCFYMDDILILGINDHIIKSTKKVLINKFDKKT
jgi:hypothetical protein